MKGESREAECHNSTGAEWTWNRKWRTVDFGPPLFSPFPPPLHLHGITKGRSKNGRGGDINGIISSIVEYWKVLTGVYNNIRIINYPLWCCTMNSIESLAIIRFICGEHPVYRWEWQCRRFGSKRRFYREMWNESGTKKSDSYIRKEFIPISHTLFTLKELFR